VILDHIPQDPGGIVIAGPGPNAFGLRHGDWHMVNIVVVPDGFKARVGEAEDQHVLDRLFPQVVIDAVELLLTDDLEQLAIQRTCGHGIMPKRLFDNNPPPAAGALEQRRRAELGDNFPV
jgi:hypothetical protein